MLVGQLVVVIVVVAPDAAKGVVMAEVGEEAESFGSVWRTWRE